MPVAKRKLNATYANLPVFLKHPYGYQQLPLHLGNALSRYILWTGTCQYQGTYAATTNTCVAIRLHSIHSCFMLQLTVVDRGQLALR